MSSYQIQRHEGISVNVGVIQGGVSPSIVASDAEARINIRFDDVDQQDIIRSQLERIVSHSIVKGSLCAIEGNIIFPPMARTPGVVDLYRRVVMRAAEDLGIDVPETSSGGGSDAAFAVMAGAPCVCAMGPVGGMNHSPEEYALVKGLLERTKLLALCIDYV